MRLIEVITKDDKREEIKNILDNEKIFGSWSYHTDDNEYVLKILTDDENSRDILEGLENQNIERSIIYNIEGTSPKIEDDESKPEKINIGRFRSISKEELYDDISSPVKLSLNYLLMVILSAFVAGIGILKNNVPILIGAMVIAPFLNPNISLAFGTTLGDWPVIKKSLISGIVATAIALGISMIWGYLVQDPTLIAKDPNIEYQDIILALICGFAGVISVLSGQGSTLVGVMVAAALLPPLMRSGLLLGAGEVESAFNSFLIFSTNVISLNFAGIATFYLAGIKPANWWEEERAQQKRKVAMIFWLLLLILLIVATILFENYYN